jgi:predicted homoserine dehydrogenase-like protein
MIYSQLFDGVRAERPVCVGVFATGQCATAIVTQSVRTKRLAVLMVADTDLEAAERAYRAAGSSPSDVAVCESRAGALAAMEQGKCVIHEDTLLLPLLPVDVIVESTGAQEAGASHASEAIRQGKHVVMVNKETDCVVGPILKNLADQAGLVHTAADGDQPSLLLGLPAWAEELGLEVLCAGKAAEHDLIVDLGPRRASHSAHAFRLGEADVLAWQPLPPGQTRQIADSRHGLISDPSHGAGFLAEMAIVANATSLSPDGESLHFPVARTGEISEFLCPAGDGGLLQKPGIVDGNTCLREPHEAGMAGGVVVVVGCQKDHAGQMLARKGHATNSRGSAMLIYRSYHLLGVETATSILCVQLLGQPTGATKLKQRFDVVAWATRTLRAGEVLDRSKDEKLQALMQPAQPVMAGATLPYYMVEGNELAVDVPAGTMLTADMVLEPADSVLWSLRSQQDQIFVPKESGR